MTNSLLAARIGSQTPRVANYPSYSLSGAPEFIDLARTTGLIPDPWQEFSLTHGLGMTPAGRWTANKVGCWVPRQNGKGGDIEVLELGWLFITKEELIVHSAHQHRTSQRAYVRLERLIRNTPHLHRQVRQYRQANGEQQIELRDGRMLQYTTRSRTALKGFSAPKLILDEAQELTAEQMAAILPTVSAMDNWQVWFFGTPPDDPAAWVYGLKDDGEGATPRLAWFDWGLGIIPTDADERARLAADVGARYRANPAMGIRIAEETVEDEARPSGLGVDKFLRERLGMWLPRAVGGSGVITADLWRDLAVEAKRPEDVAFAIHVNLTRTYAAITYAGLREDGSMLVGLADWRPGTSWVVQRAADLKQRWNPVAVGVDTRSESLLLELEKAGITPPEDPERPKRGDLAVPTASEAAAAFGMFVDAARAKALHHLDEGPLNVAVAGAKTRTLAGGSTWDHKSSVEIGPLSSATLAHWAYLTRIEKVTDESEPEALWL